MSTPTSPLRVAVITPYYQESLDVLRTCHESVLGQTYPCTHFLVSDGSPHAAVRDWTAEHILLGRPHGDVGNTPRAIGSFSAMNRDFDAIAYLDADNWYYPNHIESMVTLHQRTGAIVCSATRSIHRLDGSLMYTDTFECDGDGHVDTSCLFLLRPAFGVLPFWAMMPKQLGPTGDMIIWTAIRARGFLSAHHAEPTVAFRTQYQLHYQNVGESPPPETKSTADSTIGARSWWDSLPSEVRAMWHRYLFGVDPS
jgi:hypothetical protein